MKYIKHLIATAAAALSLGAAQAATVTYFKTFDLTSPTLSGSGSYQFISNGYLSAPLAAFDASLGTLNGFSVSWSTGVVSTFSVGSSGGSAGMSGGGSYAINGVTYSSDSLGNGNGGSPFSTGLTVSTSADELTSFTVANAGRTYDPRILAAVTGTGPVTLAYQTALSLSYTGVTAMDTVLTGRAAITYDYTAAPSANDVPEPASLALVAAGLLAAGVARRRQPR